jgi:hypothetical protein
MLILFFKVSLKGWGGRGEFERLGVFRKNSDHVHESLQGLGVFRKNSDHVHESLQGL